MVPDVAGSSPATLRRNVVLPQPLGPTTAMNSPRSTATSILVSASSLSNHLLRPEISSLRAMVSVLGPGHEFLFHPAEARRHGDAGDGQHDHAGKQVRHVEGVRRLADQAAEAGARAEQFGHHDADQPAADTELQ